MAVKGPKDAIPRIGRNVDPEMLARTAGILGVIETADAHAFLAQGGSVFSSTVGNEHEDVWGQLVGDEVGEAYGVGGLGLVGTSRGGGGEASGVIGLSHTGFLGTKGVGGKGGLSYGDTGGTTFGGRKERRPVVRVAHGEIEGALDKDIVRRVVRAHINEVRSCYNAGLTKNPNLGGRVLVQFVIGGNGKVHTSVVGESSVDDPGVGQCVAKAVRRWQFPKPHAGGQVFVSYPFVLDVA
jgi:TonB family protein